MKISKLLNGIFTVFLVLMVLFVVGSMLPIPGNYRLLIVQSGSMEPAIHTGSVVVVRPEADYKAGDVITFGDAGKDKTTTHRVVDLEVAAGKTYFITKGDANKTEDTDRVSEGKVIGRVQASIPYAGYLLAAAKEPAGFVLLVIVPCVIVIFEEILNIRKELKVSGKSKHTPNPSQEGNTSEVAFSKTPNPSQEGNTSEVTFSKTPNPHASWPASPEADSEASKAGSQEVNRNENEGEDEE
ncbi:MAG: signal peptidase I [Candidatus Paceibacterota bacterium]|jgi:signal peptidase